MRIDFLSFRRFIIAWEKMYIAIVDVIAPELINRNQKIVLPKSSMTMKAANDQTIIVNKYNRNRRLILFCGLLKKTNTKSEV